MVAPLLLATLAIQPGFHEAKQLEPAASYVARKPIVVTCADSADTWRAFLDANYPPGTKANGSTQPGSSVIQLAPAACPALGGQLSHPRADPAYAFAASLQILVHESLHAAGMTDEAETDCSAVHRVPGIATRFFHVKAGKHLRALMTLVWAYRATGPETQRSVC
jgi:hypothetical protein